MFAPMKTVGTAFEDFTVAIDGDDEFTLSIAPSSIAGMLVCVDGDCREAEVGFTLAGAVVTLVVADTLAGQTVRIFYR